MGILPIAPAFSSSLHNKIHVLLDFVDLNNYSLVRGLLLPAAFMFKIYTLIQ